ncbi:YcaO-like family protein [Streptomyces sp. TRM66268-LWL]|uniref:YcaO-like family protein n=1 Tax=Streptomyces polyasparticus TaxID=2767826 RepID=A0ABR7SIC4_9ACTN|nr:YcaO-like family protein [Streptomyces polyasparticus]MBC9714722.1 YcaO-like family protein [Streptomyces polyasparticus]
MTTLPLEALVDPVCGIVRKVKPVEHPAGAPPRYTAMTAEIADARRLGLWPADRVSLGTAFGDPETARIAAIAEGVERYCGNRVPPPGHPDAPLRATAAELAEKGLRLYGPGDLPAYADWQYAREKFPYRPFTEDTPALWARGAERMPGGESTEVWAPVALTHLNWRQGELRSLPRTHHLNYAGIATGQGFDDAVERALLEIAERDALEVWWHLDGPARGIDPATVPGLAEDLDGCGLKVWLTEMPSEFAPCMAALVHDPRLDLYAAGFACKYDPAEAARKAVLEAVHTWVFTQGLTGPDGWVFQAVDAGLLAKGLYLDHREDRCYLDACGEQFEHVRDLGAHVQVWLDPRMAAESRRFTEPALGTVPLDAVTRGSRERFERALRAGGHRVMAFDLTTEDVAETSLRVARVLVSGLIPNAPAAFGYFGCPRLADAALARGWRLTAPGAPADFTLAPPPHM